MMCPRCGLRLPAEPPGPPQGGAVMTDHVILRDEIRSIVNRLGCDPDDVTGEILDAILPLLGEDVIDDEWRVVHQYGDSVCAECWETCGSEDIARRDLAEASSENGWGDAWIEHRRIPRVAATEWERVPS